MVLECESPRWEQCASDRVTVSGASRLGFYPFVSRTPRLHFGLLARDAQVDYFNRQHARLMAVLGATCLLLGLLGSILSYCWTKRQKKAMKKLRAKWDAREEGHEEAEGEVELATQP